MWTQLGQGFDSPHLHQKVNKPLKGGFCFVCFKVGKVVSHRLLNSILGKLNFISNTALIIVAINGTIFMDIRKVQRLCFFYLVKGSHGKIDTTDR